MKYVINPRAEKIIYPKEVYLHLPRYTGLCLVFLFFIQVLHAQNYWQQEVNYKINVRLDDVHHELFADETIEYINNSPDDLSFLYFHLWPNAYKNNKTAFGRQCRENNKLDFYFAKEKDRGYIDQLDFKVDGEAVKMLYMGDSIDICKIFLNRPVKSSGKITITTPFHVKIPLGIFSRLGHIDQQYQISQWYPKPAVYDANGWNPIPYLDQGEFYSEFGSFDVSITLPENYVLGATGDMVDGEKELEWLVKIAEKTKTKDFSKTKTVYEKGSRPKTLSLYSDSFPVSSSQVKTLRFRQSRVHDFAWFCDKRYNVLKGEVELPHSKRKVNTWVMFTNGQGRLWKDAIPYMNDAIYYYSLWNGDYGYNNVTAVDGALSAGGGMEYPNITVIGEATSAFMLDVVITHEVGHNWFYGMLGSNERMHAWMDEGINSANENRYVRTKYPDALLVGELNPAVARWFSLDKYRHKAQYELAYLLNAKKNEDQSCDIPAYEYTQLNYAGIVYSKTAIIFDYLRAYLGDELYDKCAQNYFETWKFRHPMPGDIRKIYEETTGKNLSWFFDDLIETTKKLDYKIVKASKIEGAGSGYEVRIYNSGEIAGPVCVSALSNGKITEAQWAEGFAPGTSQTIKFSGDGNIDRFRIDPTGDLPEISRSNNSIRTHGIFKKSKPVQLQFLGSLNNPDKKQLFYSPVIGWNNYNGFMVGMALYNNILPEKKFEYVLMPMYGTRNKDLAGGLEMILNFHPGKIFQSVQLGVNAERYAFADQPLPYALNYNKVAPYLQLTFKKKRLRSPVSNTIKFREVGVLRDYYIGNTSFDPVINIPTTDTLLVSELAYWINNNRNINPFNAGVKLEASKFFTKLSLESNYKITFRGKDKGIKLRFFAGTFLDNSHPDAIKYMFRMNGLNGSQDYLYDEIFLGRTESSGILSNQFSEKNGGFKTFSPVGSSKNWMVAMNIKAAFTHLPLVRLFADVGTCASDGLRNDQVLYDAGVFVSLGRGLLEVFCPLVASRDIEDYWSGAIYQNIRFTLNLTMLHPFRLIRDFSL